MSTHLPRCMYLADICYSNPDFEICQAANKICWEGVIEHYDGESGGVGGRNRFDITTPCVTEGDMCYAEIPLINEYLNLPWVYEALGVPKAVGNYSVYSEAIANAFDLTSDGSISTQPQVLYLLESGVDVLFYQGNLDLACNTAGNLQWASGMRWKGQAAFVAQPKRSWGDDDGKEIGWFKEVKVKTSSGRETTFAMGTVDGAGHLVPYDKPREAKVLTEKWLGKRSFA
jgi:cathepsin A (carboxypeptidase C)